MKQNKKTLSISSYLEACKGIWGQGICMLKVSPALTEPSHNPYPADKTHYICNLKKHFHWSHEDQKFAFVIQLLRFCSYHIISGAAILEDFKLAMKWGLFRRLPISTINLSIFRVSKERERKIYKQHSNKIAQVAEINLPVCAELTTVYSFY